MFLIHTQRKALVIPTLPKQSFRFKDFLSTSPLQSIWSRLSNTHKLISTSGQISHTDFIHARVIRFSPFGVIWSELGPRRNSAPQLELHIFTSFTLFFASKNFYSKTYSRSRPGVQIYTWSRTRTVNQMAERPPRSLCRDGLTGDVEDLRAKISSLRAAVDMVDDNHCTSRCVA